VQEVFETEKLNMETLVYIRYVLAKYNFSAIDCVINRLIIIIIIIIIKVISAYGLRKLKGLKFNKRKKD
jgi:hypothetical protein